MANGVFFNRDLLIKNNAIYLLIVIHIGFNEICNMYYLPSGSVSVVQPFMSLPLNFQGILHSVCLFGPSLVVKHFWPKEMERNYMAFRVLARA